jgi:hypothetical protein
LEKDVLGLAVFLQLVLRAVRVKFDLNSSISQILIPGTPNWSEGIWSLEQVSKE